MTSNKKPAKTHRSEMEIDRIVETQANQPSAWGAPKKVRRGKLAPLSLPAELAARAVFLANIHREANLEAWLTRIIQERVEIEERAFTQAKRALSSRATS